MKKVLYILTAAALVLTGCAKEQFEHPTELNAPKTASAYNPTVTVDQELNQVTFFLGEKGLIPVWVFQDNAGEWSDYRARDDFRRIFTASGSYKVRMYVMNSCGMSPDYVEKSFTIENSLVDFSKHIKYISGGSERTWRINNSVEAHQACGESIANPTGWWSAKPDEKADFGVYDNRLTFSSDGNYTFDPGEAGTVYVNVGVTEGPYAQSGFTADYQTPMSKATTTYEFSVAGNDLMLKLPAGSPFPYIPNNDYNKDSKFYLQSLTNSEMVLVWYTPTGNGGGPIAWQFILTSKEGQAAPAKFNGFKYDADSNLWKPADAAHTYSQYYAPGWAQLPDVEVAQDGSSYSLSYPAATTDQWQAQFFIIPDEPISLSADKSYDFSVIVNASPTVPGMTFKLTDSSDDGNFLFTERIEIPAGEDYIFYRSGLAGIDAEAIKMVFDFGGNADNTDIVIKNIVLKDHAVDDGTVLPGDEPGDDPGTPEEGAHYDITGPTNLWRSATVNYAYWYSAADWSGGIEPIDPKLIENNGLTVTVPESVGGSEWMAQNQLQTNIPASADKKYDFCMTIDSDTDIPALTVKLAWLGNDNDHAFFYENNVSVVAGTPTVFKKPNIAPDTDYDAVTLFVDLGRSPGVSVKLYDICFQEHQEPQGGGGGQQGGLIEGENLWAAAECNMAYWYSDASWSGTLSPAETEILPGNGLRVVMPDGIGGSEWMGQNSFHFPGLPASKDEIYDFWMTLEADEDMTVTVKLAWEGHDNSNAFFYDNQVKLKAGEPLKYVRASIVTDDGAEERNDYDGIVLFVDTGRSPAGSEIKMSDIHFQKHIGGSEPVDPVDPGKDNTTNDPSIPASLYDVEGAGNLWRAANIEHTYWYSAADWSGALQPYVFKADDWGGIKVIIPEGIGGNEWQGQTIFHTDIPASASETYDFCVTVRSDEDINGLTFKLAWEGNDNEHAMFYVNDAVVKAGVPYQFRMKGVAPDVDYDKVVLFIDCGRCKVGTAISFTDFCFQQQGGGSGSSEGENLWVDSYLKETWFSPADWSGGLDPGAKYENGKLTLTVPDGVGGSEWQGQVKINAPVAASAAKQYSFACKIKADDDVVVTVKLADANDDSAHQFFYDNNVALAADTPLAFMVSPVAPDQDYTETMLIFDFGRCPAGTAVEVYDIELRELN